MWRAKERRGAVLLEALVALVILTTTGLATVVLARYAGDAIERARQADDETRQANAFLDVVALWPRADLDRHLGDRREGPWILRVDRPDPSLYMLTLFEADTIRFGRDTADGAAWRVGQVLFQTAVYRPGTSAP